MSDLSFPGGCSEKEFWGTLQNYSVANGSAYLEDDWPFSDARGAVVAQKTLQDVVVEGLDRYARLREYEKAAGRGKIREPRGRPSDVGVFQLRILDRALAGVASAFEVLRVAANRPLEGPLSQYLRERRLPKPIDRYPSGYPTDARGRPILLGIMASNFVFRLLECRATLQTQSFYVPSELAQRAMEMDAGAPHLNDLNLPFKHNAIWFGSPFALPDAFMLSSDPLARRLRKLFKGLFRDGGEAFLSALQDGDGAVTVDGFVLSRSKSGVLSPDVQVMTKVTVHAGEIPMNFKLNLREDSVMTKTIVNLAQLIACEQWKRPGGNLPGDLSNSTPRTRFRHAAKLAAPLDDDGRYLRVYTLDYDEAGRREAHSPTGLKASEHDRAGHYAPFRVGSRKNWPGTYVIRYVASTVVNEGQGRRSTHTVRALPLDMDNGYKGFFDGDVVRVNSEEPSGLELVSRSNEGSGPADAGLVGL